MWLHIRAVGEWTNRLYEYFEKEQEKLHNVDINPLTTEKRAISNGSMDPGFQNPIKKIQATITRTFSNREPSRKPVLLVGFSHSNLHNEDKNKVSASDGDLNTRAGCSSGMFTKRTRKFIT